jgi:hypothetical protein
MGDLVRQWRDLRLLVSGPLSEKTVQDFKEAREGFPELSSATTYELTKIFVQDSVAGEFQALAEPFTGHNRSLLDVREALAAAAVQRIDWLTKLQNDLDSFPESPKIPRGGPT